MSGGESLSNPGNLSKFAWGTPSELERLADLITGELDVGRADALVLCADRGSALVIALVLEEAVARAGTEERFDNLRRNRQFTSMALIGEVRAVSRLIFDATFSVLAAAGVGAAFEFYIKQTEPVRS